MSNDNTYSIEKEIEAALRRIFKIDKITFDDPGESGEQGCLFVNVDTSPARVHGSRFIGRVTGTISIFGQNSKVPLGFFSKAISDAEPADAKPFFFSDFESSSNRNRNLVQRSASFIYFFDSQYDPSLGTIEEINVTVNIEESSDGE